MYEIVHLPENARKETKLRTGWLGRLRGLDLNQRPPGYEPDELPDCSTPRQLDGEGFEPSKASLTDLQSAPFGHSGTHPYGAYRARTCDPLLVRQMLSQLS